MNFKEYANKSVVRTKFVQQINSIKTTLINLISIPETNLENKNSHFDQYWQSERLKSFLEKHNIFTQEIPPFADGGAGRVYFIKDKVVKLASNRVEANVAKLVANNQKLPTAIIDVQAIDTNVFAILQDYIRTTNINQKILDASDILVGLIDEHPFIMEHGWPTKERLEYMINTMIKKFGFDPETKEYVHAMIGIHQLLFKATGFFHDDSGPTNIGIHPKKGVVISDLGPNQANNYTDEKGLEKIKQNREKLGLPEFKPF